MEKGEHEMKWKVDQLQESLSDAHKTHLRQVYPSTIWSAIWSALWSAVWSAHSSSHLPLVCSSLSVGLPFQMPIGLPTCPFGLALHHPFDLLFCLPL